MLKLFLLLFWYFGT